MGNLVIVAIPEENDRVWKISSEKVPHLTLLFLGDEENADTQQIVQFVEHATTLSEHGPFYLDVDHRGVLGEDEADVIFFSKRSWNLKWIKQFRGQLLQNQQIRSAYDSTEQFDEWLPHLTLGYPETPAKEPEEGFDHPLYSVAFDRIAVWTGDFEGPEFRLEWPDRELEGDLAIAYSDTQKAALLHYGTKDVLWGQKKTEMVDGKAKQVTPNTQAKPVENTLEQTVDHGAVFVDGFVHGSMGLGEKFILEHYGIKGMRWGFRRSTPEAVAPTASSRVRSGNKRKTKIDVEGGQNHPAHDDAIKVAQARAKLKKSGSSALSNQELREVANRLQLENQVSILTSSKGKLFVKRELQTEGQNLAKVGAKKAAKAGAKKAATAVLL